MNPSSGNERINSRSSSQSGDVEFGNQAGSSPLEPLESVFGESNEFVREDYASHQPSTTSANIHPQNTRPHQDYSFRREYDQPPERNPEFGYFQDATMRQDNRPERSQTAARLWPSHRMQNEPDHIASQHPTAPITARNFQRDNVNLPQHDPWSRRGGSSPMPPHSAPSRSRLPQQYENIQFRGDRMSLATANSATVPVTARSTGGVPDNMPLPPPRPRSRELPLSYPPTSYRGQGYFYAPPPPPPPPPQHFQDLHHPDPRYAPYHHPYRPYPYYPQEHHYHHQQSAHSPYRRPGINQPNMGPFASSSASQQPYFASNLYIREVNNNDVLCGRGGATNSHIGNRAFRLLVGQYKDKYLNAKKKEKPNVAAEVVNNIRKLDPPGRFLKKDKDSGYWLDIGDTRAKEKTSQALREGAPQMRKKLSDAAKEEGASSDGTSSDKSTGSPPQSTEQHKKIPSNEALSAFSTLQQSISMDLESAANNPDNSTTAVADAKPSTSEGKEETLSKKRTSPTKKDGDKEQSPSKRQMTKVEVEQLTHEEKELYWNDFDPPRSSLRKESSDEEAEYEGDMKEDEDKTKST